MKQANRRRQLDICVPGLCVNDDERLKMTLYKTELFKKRAHFQSLVHLNDMHELIISPAESGKERLYLGAASPLQVSVVSTPQSLRVAG